MELHPRNGRRPEILAGQCERSVCTQLHRSWGALQTGLGQYQDRRYIAALSAALLGALNAQ